MEYLSTRKNEILHITIIGIELGCVMPSKVCHKKDKSGRFVSKGINNGQHKQTLD